MGNPLWLRIFLPLLALYGLLGYLMVPWVTMRVAPDWVAANLDARLEISDIHFDPFRLRLRLFEPRLLGPLDNEQFQAEDVFAASRVEAQLSFRSLRHGAPVIAFTFDAPRLHVERSAAGNLNLAALTGPTASAEGDSAPVTLGLERLLLNGGQVTVVDRSRPQPFTTSVEDIEVDLRELWLPAGAPAPLSAAMKIEGATLDVRGHIGAAPEFDLGVTLANLPLGLAERWLAGATAVERLRGSLQGSGRLTLQEDGIPRLAAGQLQLDGLDLSVPGAAATAGTGIVARLRQLTVDAVAGSLWPLDLDVRSVRLQRGDVDVEYAGAAPTTTTGPGDTATADPNGPPLALRLAELEVVDIDVTATDASLAAPGRIDVGLEKLGATGLQWPATAGQSAAVTVDATLAPQGQSSFSGDLDLGDGRLVGRLDTRQLSLPAFAPWVHAFTRLGLESGQISQQAEVELHWGTRPIDLRLLLDGRIEDLAIADPDGIDLVGWDSLDLQGLKFALAPQRITVDEVALAAPTLRFARLADGRTNLARIGPVDASATAATDTAASTPTPAQTQTQTEAGAWSWRLGRLTLDSGVLNFVDETLVIPFATRVEALSGRVDDLASSADGPAKLRLDGRIPPNGSASIEASGLVMAPFADTAVTLNFRGVPMPRMTPWTGTFAGYRVAGGRLDLDLTYRIDQGVLGASNKVTVNAMRLGEPMASPRAMDLPLRLAIALLRDSDDNITLEVPVSGNVDDPQFDLRPAILSAIGRILTNIAAAPFRLLAGLVGGSEDELDSVTYPLGSSRLDEEQEAQLLILERALGERPALGLDIPANHAGEADRAVLRQNDLERALAARSADRDEALRNLFRERHGEQELEALEASHRTGQAATETADGTPPASSSEGSSTGTLLSEIENRLLGDINISDEALQALARERAEAVYLYLTDAGLDPSRLRIAPEASQVSANGEQVPLKFELDALESL